MTDGHTGAKKGFRALVTLERESSRTLLGFPGDGWTGACRGALAAQAVVAAGHMVDTRWRWVRTVNLTWLSEVEPGREAKYNVEALRDTEHLATRLVRVAQSGRAVAIATVNFQTPRFGRGPECQDPQGADWPDPHALASEPADPAALVDLRRMTDGWEAGNRAADGGSVTDGARGGRVANRQRAGDQAAFRWVADDRVTDSGAELARAWLRLNEELPDEILLHAAGVVYAADLLLTERAACIAKAGTDLGTGRALQAEPLDLSVRIHRSFRADDWLRHECAAHGVADYRASLEGRFRSSMGRLVASAACEVALLPRPDPHPRVDR